MDNLNSSDGKKPQLHGGSLFLVDMALQFQACNQLRSNINLQKLLERLEGISLMLHGYYTEKDQPEKIRNKIIEIRRQLDEVIKEYARTEKLNVTEKLRTMFYDLESELRDVWKDSGLQMGFNNDTDDMNDY